MLQLKTRHPYEEVISCCYSCKNNRSAYFELDDVSSSYFKEVEKKNNPVLSVVSLYVLGSENVC